MTSVLPWHNLLWQHVQNCWQQNRLSHALLLAGPLGMGKIQFAQRLAKILLCENQPCSANDWQPCEQCSSCHLLNVGTHPDLLPVPSPAANKFIGIEQVRELIQFCSLTTYYGRYRIAIINPADKMNRNAANSLLKLLEEPPPKTVLMLLSHQPMGLMATIRSRCQRLDFSRPDRKLTYAWLQEHVNTFNLPVNNQADLTLLLNLSAQAPLAALALLETDGMTKRKALFENLIQLLGNKIEPIKIVEQWSQWETNQILSWLLSWNRDLIRCALTDHGQYLVNQDYRNTLCRLAQQLDWHSLFKLLDLQTEAYRLIIENTSVKATNILETIAIAWIKLGTHSRR